MNKRFSLLDITWVKKWLIDWLTGNMMERSFKIDLTWFCRAKTKQKETFEFKLVLWACSFHILLPWGHFLLVLVKAFDRGWLASTLAHCLVSLKSYLPSRKINLSCTTGWDFFEAQLSCIRKLLKVTNINYLLTISINCHKKRLW